MALTTLAWLALAAYGAHVLEEHQLDWRGWARAALGLPIEWADFHVTNAVVGVLGAAQAALAPTLVVAPLAFAALMLINAVVFHLLPFVRLRGRYSPGLATALLLFLPLGVAEFVRAGEEDRAGLGTMLGAFAVGALLMAFPVVLLKLRDRPYFRQG